VHRRFVSASAEQNAELNEMVDLCNSKIAEKDDNIASLIEENIGEIAAKISQSQQDQEPVSWPAIALMISQSRERLEQAAVAKEARIQAHASRKFM